MIVTAAIKSYAERRGGCDCDWGGGGRKTTELAMPFSTIGVVTYSESCFVLMFLVDGDPLWATLSVPMRNGDG